MEQIQRLQSDIIHDYNDITTLETNCLTNECISTFEELSNELIYEVFEYLDLHYAFQAFYDLNQRFQNLFLYPNLPIKINISSISKSTFHYYLTDIIIPHADRIKSFRLSNPFVADMIQVLRIVADYTRFSTFNMEYLNADQWEQLISTHMPNLRIFDFQHQYRSWYNNHDRQAYETRYDQTKSYHVAIFYSINPYRKSYMLYEELDKNVSSLHVETSKDSVQHVYIHNTNAMEQCLSYFPNAIELTLSETFHVPRDSIVISLNRIIPLRQLTKLTFDYHHFPFEQVIELLHFTPNVHTLKLDSILLYQ
ncbi:unnamed protein product, partial [Rotaria sp. Silwood1]